MTIRGRVIRLFVEDPTPRGVRELVLAPSLRGVQRNAVSKECLELTGMGLLSVERLANGRHRKRFIFTPQALLLRAGTLAVSNANLLRIVKAARYPLSNKDIRYAMTSLCDRGVTKSEVQEALDTLTREGDLVIAGTSTKYPLYQVRVDGQAPWCRLALVTYSWAAGSGGGGRGPRPARRGRITRRGRETVS